MEEQTKLNTGQGLGIAGLVLGIIALIISFIPCLGIYALIPGIIAIVLSVVGLSFANKANAAKGLIIAALIISIIGTAIAAWQFYAFRSAGDKFEQFGKEFSDEFKKGMKENMDEADFDELEEAMEALEDNVGDEFDNLSDEEKAGKIGTAAGKALKEFTKEVTKAKEEIDKEVADEDNEEK